MSLESMNRGRGVSSLINRQHDAPVQQFLVHRDAGGGEEQPDRPRDAIFPSRQPPAGVFGGGRDPQFPFRLEQLQGVARSACPFLFRDGEYLVLQVVFAHVVQALPGHRRELHHVFGRCQVEHGVKQGRFAGGGGRLHHDRERGVELAGHGRQIAE